MAETPTRWSHLRRVVVALDETEGSAGALEAAARLAAGLHVELLGLFIEDISFVHAAALPVSRTVGAVSRTPLPLDPDTMDRAFRVRAGHLRQRFMAITQRLRVHASFRTVRGLIAEEIVAASAEGDLLAFGRAGRRAARPQPLGSTARALAERARCPVLLLPGISHVDHPVIAFYEGSERVLGLAAELSRATGNPLRILVVSSGGDGSLRERAAAWLDAAGVSATLDDLDGSDPQAALAAIAAEQGSVAVVDAEGPIVASLGLAEVLGRLEEPTLLVR